jgi:hypothetical protein
VLPSQKWIICPLLVQIWLNKSHSNLFSIDKQCILSQFSTTVLLCLIGKPVTLAEFKPGLPVLEADTMSTAPCLLGIHWTD